MQLIKEKDTSVLFKKTAEAIVSYLAPLATERKITIGLCGGRSVVGLVNAIKALVLESSANSASMRSIFSNAHFMIIDERLVPHDSPDSNFGMLNKTLFQELIESNIIEETQLHPFYPCESETDFGTAGYTAEFAKLGEHFDLVVLGVGEDGHVAGLFPRHPSLQRTEKLFLSFSDSPKPPAGRMTATLPILQQAGASVLLFTSEAKRDAWNRFNDVTTRAYECPCVFLKASINLIVATDLT